MDKQSTTLLPLFLTFASVVEAGSFTAAADRLGCSKALVSKQISALEAALGMTLLFRTTRRLSLTRAGQVLHAQVADFHTRVVTASEQVRALKDTPTGIVRLSVPVSLGEAVFESVLADFCASHPQVQVELDLSNALRDLAADRVDLAVRAAPLEDPNMVARPLGNLLELTCASPDYLARRGRPLAPMDLTSHECLVNSHYGEARLWRYFRDTEVVDVPVRGRLACNHYTLLLTAARAGRGIARLPTYLVQDDLARGRLQWLLAGYQSRISTFHLIYPYQGRLPLAVRLLADHIVAWFSRHSEALQALRPPAAS